MKRIAECLSKLGGNIVNSRKIEGERRREGILVEKKREKGEREEWKEKNACRRKKGVY